MYNVSDLFKQYICLLDRELDCRIDINESTIYASDIVEFEIDNPITTNDEFTLGTTVASTLTVSIKSSVVIPSKAKITPYIRVNTPLGFTEWFPLGVFYVDSRNKQNGVLRLSCYDKLVTTSSIFTSSLSFPIALSEVVKEIAVNLSLDINSDTLALLNDCGLTLDVSPEGYTYRQMLSYISSALGCCTKIDNVGKLKFIKFSASSMKTTLTTRDYIKIQQIDEKMSYSKLEMVFSDDNDMYIGGDSFVDSENTIVVYNELATQEYTDTAYNTINGFSYVPFIMDWRGLPYLEAGDTLEIIQNNGTSIITTMMDNKLSYKGGILCNTSAPCTSTLKHEFVPSDSVSKKIQAAASTAAQSLIYYTNNTLLSVNQTSQQPAYLSLSATKDTNLKLFIAIHGTTSTVSTLAIKVLFDNKELQFTVKQKLQIGDNLIGLPLIIPQVATGPHYLGVALTVDAGTFTIEISNMQVSLEGGSLKGGLSAKLPHAEVIQNIAYIDTKLGIQEENIGAHFDALINTILPQQVINFVNSYDGNIVDNVTVTLSVE